MGERKRTRSLVCIYLVPESKQIHLAFVGVKLGQLVVALAEDVCERPQTQDMQRSQLCLTDALEIA
jgi:hypothetical protein